MALPLRPDVLTDDVHDDDDDDEEGIVPANEWQQRLTDRLRDSPHPAAGAVESVDVQICEGLLIAASGVRLALKNRIILRALQDRRPIDEAWLAQALKDEVESLVHEKLADATRVERMRPRAAQRRGPADHVSDYRRDDLVFLQQREEVNRGTAEQLSALLFDDDFVSSTTGAAREAAVDEMVQARLAIGVERSSAKDDHADRQQRLHRLRRDLDALVKPSRA